MAGGPKDTAAVVRSDGETFEPEMTHDDTTCSQRGETVMLLQGFVGGLDDTWAWAIASHAIVMQGVKRR